jgi:SOS-response transcriptional repressor LexA
LARTLELKYDKVNSYFSGKAEPGSEFWRLLAEKFPNTDIMHLVTGFKNAIPIADDWKEIPILDHIPAGPLVQGFGERGTLGHVRLPCSDPQAFVLVVDGTSMSPEIMENDMVLCSPKEPFVNGKVYAVVAGEDEHTLKRVRRDWKSGSYILIPTNKEFLTEHVPEEQIIRLVRVIQVLRDY